MSVNVENVLKVADAIEKHSIEWLGFNMKQFIAQAGPEEDWTGNACGTVACIVGWANALGKNLSEPSVEDMSDELFAADFLGIEYFSSDWEVSTSDALFYAHAHPGYDEIGTAIWPQISAEQAVRTLRNLAATGEVDWTV